MINEDERDEIIARFLPKVHKTESCWLWTGTRNNQGYGMFSVKINGQRKNRLAHRVSWVLRHRESIPDGLILLHSCDNRRCVNPDHLRIGTHEENMADMVSKHRNTPEWRYFNNKFNPYPSSEPTREVRNLINDAVEAALAAKRKRDGLPPLI